MATADDPPSTPPEPSRIARKRSPWAKGMICVTILPLMGFIGQTGRDLWTEWGALRTDQVAERSSAVIGYLNINPDPSLATKPRDWWHDEGNQTLLWAGWREGEHQWYRFGRGDLDGLDLSLPIGRDRIRVIDRPIYERRGGAIWDRVPDDAPIAAFAFDSGPTAYPIKVLDKVEVVNERVNARPILVAYTPIVDDISVYEATLDGRPITLGHSGFFNGHDPVLYDRATLSFWIGRVDGMTAVAGPRKGAKLPRIARSPVIAWSDWRADHPEGRLLVGANRSGPRPAE